MSFPSPPISVSLSAQPFNVSPPLLPLILLSSRLPMPFKDWLLLKHKFSTLLGRVKLIKLVSIVSLLFAVN